MRTNCTDIQQALSLLVAGELPEDEAKQALAHVESCEACARLLARFRRQDELLRATAPTLGADELKLMALRARTGSHAASREQLLRRIVAAAAVVLALVIPTATYFTFAPCKDGPEGLDAVATAFDMDF